MSFEEEKEDVENSCNDSSFEDEVEGVIDKPWMTPTYKRSNEVVLKQVRNSNRPNRFQMADICT